MTLIEAYEKTPTNLGVVSDYSTWVHNAYDNVPYLPTSIVGSIDNMYYLMHSGDKFISPYVQRCLNHDYPSPTGWRVLIGKDLATLYHDQLMKEWALFVKEYDPLAAYDVTETVEYDHTGGGEFQDSGSDTRKQSGKIMQGGSVKTENKASTYEADDKKTGESTVNYAPAGDNLYTQYGENGNSPLVNELEYGKKRESSETGHDDLTTTKSGNLGILVPSQLIGTDIELWKMNFYQNIMFPLFDKVLTLPIY